MEAQWPKTFTEYVAWMASNSPHATLLDWWRRLELNLKEYAASRGLTAHARGHFRMRSPKIPSSVPKSQLRCCSSVSDATPSRTNPINRSRGTKLPATPSVRSNLWAFSENWTRSALAELYRFPRRVRFTVFTSKPSGSNTPPTQVTIWSCSSCSRSRRASRKFS